MSELSTEIIAQRVKDLEDRYLRLTNEMQIVLGALNESKMYLKFLAIPNSGPYAMDSLINRLERAVADSSAPVEADKNTAPVEA